MPETSLEVLKGQFIIYARGLENCSDRNTGVGSTCTILGHGREVLR